MSEIRNIPRLRFHQFNEKWIRSTIGNCFQIVGGGTPSTTDTDFWDGNINWFTPTEIKERKVGSSLRKITEKGLKSSSAKILPVNTLLFTSRATIGQMSFSTQECTTNQGFQSILPSLENDNRYFYYWSLLNKKTFLRKSTGSTFLEISKKTIEKIQIYIPLLPEQQKIADFLTAVDKRIELLENKKTLLETYKKGVMKKIFNQEIRFKDDNGKDFPNWEEKKVKDVFRITRGNVLSVNQMTETENLEFKYPVYSSQTKNKGIVGYYNEFLFQDSLTWTTDGANAGEVNFRKGKFYCTNVCGVLISEDGYANECISNLINSISKRYVSYVGNPKLMNGVMAEIKLSFPSIREQIKISKFLSSIDEQIELLESHIEKSKTWKKGLLQKMFV